MVEGIYNGILGAIRTEYNGQKQIDLFTTSLDDPDTTKKRAAESFVVEMLEKSHMFKVYHNSAGGLPALGDLIKKEGFRDADHRPGTFGKLYRYSTVHWQLTRLVERLVPQPSNQGLIRATPTTPKQLSTKKINVPWPMDDSAYGQSLVYNEPQSQEA